MKEYNLSRSSKYSVLYLLSGLFMFFFMFAILNLSSFASQDGTSAFPYYVIDRYNTDNYTEMFPAGTNYSSLVNNTDVDKYYHLVGRVNVVPDSLTNTDEEFSIVLNTSDGSFNLCTSSATSTMGSYNFSFDIYFKGKYSSLVRYEKEHVGGVGSQYAFYTYTVLIDSCSEVSSSAGSSIYFSDYSSYSPITLSTPVYFVPSFSSVSADIGSPLLFNFSHLSTSNLKFTSEPIAFGYCNTSQLMFFLYYETPSISNTSILSDLDMDFYIGTTPTHYHLSDFTLYEAFINSNGYFSLMYGLTIDLPSVDSYTLCSVQLLSVNTGGSLVENITFSGFEYKMTIKDYMDYVKENYDNISPSVTDLNQNTAQSVSDIGTAQTFETSAFDNFNNQFSSSGLDSFSLTYASTPLLWVSSIITNFYNNMPSMFQYLIMFVAFIGILCTVLNVFGRVAQRFGGGDSATKLNSNDVFSKIEKNGSI